MIKRLFVGLIALFLMLVQCSDDSVNPIHPGPDRSPSPPASAYGSLFEIEEGHSVVIDDDQLEIGFSRVLGESRCPSNVVCIWPGEASIELWLKKPGADSTSIAIYIDGLTGNLKTPNHRSVDTLGYLFTLVNLDPYPMISDPPDEPEPDPSVARLLVLKKHQEGITGIIAINNTPPEQLVGDRYGLGPVHVSDDGLLTMAVAYSGGCGNHYLQLYMSPATFFESYPAQANLYLFHFDADDPCDAIVTTTVRFDVSPVADLYLQMYGRHDPIILNVYDYFDDMPSSRKSVTYIP